jgi:hypothetical protein
MLERADADHTDAMNPESIVIEVKRKEILDAAIDRNIQRLMRLKELKRKTSGCRRKTANRR